MVICRERKAEVYMMKKSYLMTALKGIVGVLIVFLVLFPIY